MASSFLQFLLLFGTLLFLLLVTSVSDAQPSSFRPSAIVLPVRKDSFTLQYLTLINQRTPLVPVNLVIDLGGELLLWDDCEKDYVSSSYLTDRCLTTPCTQAKSSTCVRCSGTPGPLCNKDGCNVNPFNPALKTFAPGVLNSDVMSVNSTNGSNPGRVVVVPIFYYLACSNTFHLEGLGSGNVQGGVAGFGRAELSLPSQISSAFSFDRKFAICLTSSTRSNGVIFVGDGPYMLLPNIDVSKSLIYTPLIINPVDRQLGGDSSEYFIGVKSIKINNNRVSLNETLLSINDDGKGGTRISTTVPYTVLETSVYHALTEAYIKEAAKSSMNMTRVASVAPFGVCFSSKNIASTRVGPAVPTIDLVLQNETVFWRISGANSMVNVRDGVLCLGFVDGGSNPWTTIVIGGYQLEDNLLQFDLTTSRLGFSSSLLFKQTTCSNFNFTSTSSN